MIFVIAVLAAFVLMIGVKRLSYRPTPSTSASSHFPKIAHIGRNHQSVELVHDDVALHYVFYYAGDFGSSSSGSQNTHSLTWMDEGGITLKGGRTFGYHRESTDPDHVRVNGKDYDLRQGRVLVLHDDGTVEQLGLFPALTVAQDPEAVAKLLVQAGTTAPAPPRFQLPSSNAATSVPQHIEFKVLRVENPPGTRDILLHFERDTNAALGLEVWQDVTPSDGLRKQPEPGTYRNWQVKTWAGVNDHLLGWTLPKEFTEAEVRTAAREIEKRAQSWRQLEDGRLWEFATVAHRDGWKYHLLATVKRAPGLPVSPPSENLTPKPATAEPETQK